MSLYGRFKARFAIRPVSLSGGVFPIFFVHIPKTAGTSFRFGFEKYALRQEGLLFDYGEQAQRTSDFIRDTYKRSDPWQVCKRVRDRSVDMLAGHVAARKYVHAFGVASTITFLRDPLQRVFSEYQHACRHNGYQKDFAFFYRNPRNQNRQSQLLRGVMPDALGFVGITERYQESLAGINVMLGTRLAESERNTGREDITRRYEFAAEVEAELLALNAEDIELYQRFDRQLTARLALWEGGHDYIHGRVVSCDARSVSGWAWAAAYNGAPADQPVELELLCNGQVIQRMVAKEPRQDVMMLSPPRAGYVGFSCLHDCQAGDVLSCRVAGSGQLLVPESIIVPSS